MTGGRCRVTTADSTERTCRRAQGPVWTRRPPARRSAWSTSPSPRTRSCRTAAGRWTRWPRDRLVHQVLGLRAAGGVSEETRTSSPL